MVSRRPRSQSGGPLTHWTHGWVMRTFSWLSFFFFSSRRRHTRYWRDWSSDVCSSDLGVAILGAGLTAFYMTRLMLMTFFGRPRWEEGVHPHESPSVMTLPMIVLAVGSVVAGFLLVEAFPLSEWMAPVFGEPEEAEHVIAPLTFGIGITVVALLGVALAWLFVGRREVPVTAPARVSPVVRAARNALYADTVNESLFMRPGQWLTRALVFFDNRGVDGAVNGMAAALGGSSARLGRAQTGFVRSYALGMLGGAVVVAGALLAVTTG